MSKPEKDAKMITYLGRAGISIVTPEGPAMTIVRAEGMPMVEAWWLGFHSVARVAHLYFPKTGRIQAYATDVICPKCQIETFELLLATTSLKESTDCSCGNLTWMTTTEIPDNVMAAAQAVHHAHKLAAETLEAEDKDEE